MLGDFLTRLLVLCLGYAYPSFECYKCVEKNRVSIDELRFWCQYWIIIGFLTVVEKIGDLFVSWMPFYGEMKIVALIYLWSSKTKGTSYVYQTFLRPMLVKHEPVIDRKLKEVKTRAWDVVMQYGQNITKTGQLKLFQVIQMVIAQSGNATKGTDQAQSDNSNEAGTPTPRPSSTGAPPNSPAFRAANAGSPKNNHDEFADKVASHRDRSPRLNENFQQARMKLRRSTTPIRV